MNHFIYLYIYIIQIRWRSNWKRWKHRLLFSVSNFLIEPYPSWVIRISTTFRPVPKKISGVCHTRRAYAKSLAVQGVTRCWDVVFFGRDDWSANGYTPENEHGTKKSPNWTVKSFSNLPLFLGSMLIFRDAIVGLGWRLEFLGFPYERDCCFGGTPIRGPQTTGPQSNKPNH